MRKVVLQMMTTLNGRVDDPDAWISGVPDDLYAEIDRAYATFDTVLVGRTTYEEMLEFWPGAEADPGGSDTHRSMARKMNSYRKLVFSAADEPRTLEWNNSELVLVHSDEEIVRFVNELKSRSGGDIHLAGGARLAQTFVRLGLLDGYRFVVHPAVSAGAQWFDQVEGRRDMKLSNATVYDEGIVGLYYEPEGT
jgi:dihydrofolate reductase